MEPFRTMWMYAALCLRTSSVAHAGNMTGSTVLSAPTTMDSTSTTLTPQVMQVSASNVTSNSTINGNYTAVTTVTPAWTTTTTATSVTATTAATGATLTNTFSAVNGTKCKVILPPTGLIATRVRCGVLCARDCACTGFNFRRLTSECGLSNCSYVTISGVLEFESDPSFSYFSRVLFN